MIMIIGLAVLVSTCMPVLHVCLHSCQIITEQRLGAKPYIRCLVTGIGASDPSLQGYVLSAPFRDHNPRHPLKASSRQRNRCVLSNCRRVVNHLSSPEGELQAMGMKQATYTTPYLTSTHVKLTQKYSLWNPGTLQ